MKRLALTLSAGFAALLLMGFTFLTLADPPVTQTRIIKTLPAPDAR